MSKVLVVAPHADDETLGCGGTLLRHVAQGDEVHWLLATRMVENGRFTAEQVKKREMQIHRVSSAYQFAGTHRLTHPTSDLDQVGLNSLIDSIRAVMERVGPQILYVPYRGDAHSDHSAVFDACAACSKSFRNAALKRFLMYETLSETGFSMNPDVRGFRPNVFIDVAPYLDQKVNILKLYDDEMGAFPFPRSEQAVRALAALRGAEAACQAAEAFMLAKEIL